LLEKGVQPGVKGLRDFLEAYESAKSDPRILIDKLLDELIDGLAEEIRKEPYPASISSMSAVAAWNYLMDTIIPTKAKSFKASLNLGSKAECECDEISNGETCRKCGPSPDERPTHTKSVTIGGLQYGGYRIDYD
jgi:hypothetical protein